MARVLALSSHVAFGSVGLAVIVPALQALGHEVVALPTVVLSNHPGYARFSGEHIAPAALERMIDSLDANGWLAGIDGVLTGYLPTPRHVRVAEAAVRRIREANASLLFVCDPVFGDDPGGLYLEEAAAAAIRERLLPLCDVATPNRFELAWLSGKPVTSVEEAAAAARALGVPTVLATSIPEGEKRLATLLVGASEARACFVPRREVAPHGTGDLLAALYLGHALNGANSDACLARAAAAVEASIAASSSRDELSLAGAVWARAEPLPTRAV
jgi:pyridoxine kinase